MKDDDSWEIATQAALDIHRRVISAVRERVTTGTREMRPRTSTLRSCSDGRARPGSAPPRKAKRCTSYRTNNHDDVFMPSLANISTMNATSAAELQAWETLRNTTEGEQRPRRSRSTVSFERARPNGVPTEYYLMAATWAQQQQGVTGLLSTPLTSCTRATRGYPRTTDDPRVGASNGRNHNSSGHEYAGQQALARDQGLCSGKTVFPEPDAIRHRETERGRSDLSIRFLREHARKVRKEEKAFVRTLWAEARATEDSQIEMIHRATQRSRDLGKDVLYLPHRVEGKLHVLKNQNGIEAAKLHEGRSRGGLRKPEGDGTVISMDAFIKGDHARLEKYFYTARGRVFGNKDGAATRCTKIEEPPKSKGSSSRKHVRDHPDAANTCRQLHQLIRDTVGLVEVLTSQAVELERQGWNRPPEGRRIVKRRGASR